MFLMQHMDSIMTNLITVVVYLLVYFTPVKLNEPVSKTLHIIHHYTITNIIINPFFYLISNRQL